MKEWLSLKEFWLKDPAKDHDPTNEPTFEKRATDAQQFVNSGSNPATFEFKAPAL
jgi:hypothetical protein